MATTFRTCPLCEATCGLAIETDGDAVTRVRGDAEDVFSKGFLCPKGVSIKELHDDPDRLRAPLVRQADGSFAEVSWDEAFARVDELLNGVIERHGRDAVAAYLGNPGAHSLGTLLYGRVLIKALGTKNVYSASTVDQWPKQYASGLMFGTPLSVPVPDLDRTSYLMVLGANPLASNGSLMTAPDARGRLRAIRARGGKVVVVDPRRSRTAMESDEHLAVRPGTDALLLLGIAHTLFSEGLVDLGAADGLVRGLDELRELAIGFPPEESAVATGIDAETVRRIARELAAAESSAVYGRIGTTTTRFGAVTSWLVDAVNVLTGSADRPGGAMWNLPAAGSPTTRGEPGRGRGVRAGRWTSRVRGLPEVFGELPVAALAEEILEPGDGQVRALVTIAGNPAVSTPDSGRLEEALESLECFVALDIYLNETSRHAHVILPAPSALERSHFDVALYAFAVRNVANYSPPVLPLPPGAADEWETLLRLTGVVTGQGPDADVAALDAFIAAEAVRRETADPHSCLAGGDVDAVMAALEPRVGPERLLDLMLRTGPYGAGFPSLGLPGRGAARGDGGLTLAVLEAQPHGIDLGPLEPRLPEVLRTPDGLIDLAPAPLVEDAAALSDEVERWAGANGDEMLLIGRRHLRSNNSWMHNLPMLARGPERCTVQVHPEDASRLGVLDGEAAVVTSRVGSIELTAEVTDDIRPGVVSIPHGWGHDAPGARLAVAAERPGANSNVLTDGSVLEPLTGTAVLNGIPVTVAPVRQAAPA